MTFLFIASIGPVQPFIASARRTRDLYGGSTLLSEVSKAAAREITNSRNVQAQLIFPSPDAEDQLEPGTSLNVANKIVAILDISANGKTPSEEISTLGEAVRQAIEERLTTIRENAFGTLQFADEKAVQEQLDNLIEYSWVAVPFASSSAHDAYQKARRQAEAVLAARKNTSLFAPVTWGSEMEKSSIDGKLECVIPDHLYKGQQEKNARMLYQWYNAGPHERLSAVDLLKRLSAEQLLKTDEKSIPHVILSTSHIAATPFLQRLNKMPQEKQERAIELWEKYITTVGALIPASDQRQVPSSPLFEKLPLSPQGSKLPEKYLINDVIGRYDGALLFEERLLDDMVNKEKERQKDSFKNAQSALKEFFKAVDMRPSPYYALLLADGDGMGKAIENHAHGQDGPSRHRELSQILSRFSMEVAATVHKYYGALIYAGGDDIMALLPLDTAPECAYELAQAFREKLQDFRYLDAEGKEKSPTLSAGIAVIHHVSLLDEALALARQAEHKAKEQAQKNSLAIIIRKRSGEDYPLVVSWPEEKVNADAPSGPAMMSYEHLQDLIVLYAQAALPKGTAYELRDMVQRLQPAKGDPHSETLRKIIQIDAARILRRKLMLSDTDTKKETEATLVKLLQFIGIKKGEKDAFQVEREVDINQCINAFIVAQTFAEPLEEQKEKEVPGE